MGGEMPIPTEFAGRAQQGHHWQPPTPQHLRRACCRQSLGHKLAVPGVTLGVVGDASAALGKLPAKNVRP